MNWNANRVRGARFWIFHLFRSNWFWHENYHSKMSSLIQSINIRLLFEYLYIHVIIVIVTTSMEHMEQNNSVVASNETTKFDSSTHIQRACRMRHLIDRIKICQTLNMCVCVAVCVFFIYRNKNIYFERRQIVFHSVCIKYWICDYFRFHSKVSAHYFQFNSISLFDSIHSRSHTHTRTRTHIHTIRPSRSGAGFNHIWAFA